ncbi:MAG: flgH [Rhizobacter sp.]|nr:flgH [Rhizobacter sp.]
MSVFKSPVRQSADKSHSISFRRLSPRDCKHLSWLGAACLGAVLAGCAAEPSIVPTPYTAPPLAQPAFIERANTGSIYQPNGVAASLFSTEKKPRYVGDTLKVDIAETLSTSSKIASNTSRENKLASKGPGNGSDSLGGLLKGIVNQDTSASGSDSFKGAGNTDSSNKFNGRIAASVINVLANGNLLVAGQRSIAVNQGITTLRFSGVVNPTDIKPGNVVASSDVVDARLEAVGQGDTSDASSRTWLQRVLTKGLSIW